MSRVFPSAESRQSLGLQLTIGWSPAVHRDLGRAAYCIFVTSRIRFVFCNLRWRTPPEQVALAWPLPASSTLQEPTDKITLLIWRCHFFFTMLDICQGTKGWLHNILVFSWGQLKLTCCPAKLDKQNGFMTGLACVKRWVNRADPRTKGTYKYDSTRGNHSNIHLYTCKFS